MPAHRAHRTRDASARALGVSTDTPPPTVAIISPTPRAFTFPIQDTRFPPSPSSSPFEASFKSIPSTPPPLRSFSPTSSIGSDSTLSLLSSPSASQASHKRRRSTASDIGERRPKKGDDDYIKRPENAFILFRRKCCEDRQAALEDEEANTGPVKKQRQADLSKTISQQWKALAPEERQKWEDMAKEKKREHEAMYPNYVYRPQRVKKTKKGKARNGGEPDTDAESLSFLLPVSSSPTSRSFSRDSLPGHASSHGHGRRALSLPTPEFQAIRLPTVHMPSCPTSPHLVPRISGRTPLPNIPPPSDNDPLTSFEYSPDDNLFSPSYQVPNAFEGNMQTYYHNMFQQMPSQNRDGPLLHALTIPDSGSMSSMMSPAESIASSLFSPAHPYSPSSPQAGVPFTPADALSMMSFGMGEQPINKDSPANGEYEDSGVTYGSFWPREAIWGDMEALMNEDFNLASIPPVELGLAHVESRPPQQEEEYPEFEQQEFLPMSEEHDYHDPTPGLDQYAGMFNNAPMSW